MSPESRGWRLIVDAAADGAWNMALDEALLESLDADPSRAPVLRLYGWGPPALSLGRSQPSAGAYDAAFLRREGIELVRRPTGGRAVLHEHERTYALVAPLERGPFGRRILDNYRQIASALERALRALGAAAEASPVAGGAGLRARGIPSSCFATASAHEITVAGRKLVGSAQRRRRRAFLQHGSILVVADARRLAGALGTDVSAERFTDLTHALGRTPTAERIDAAMVEAFAAVFEVELRLGRPQVGEIERASALRSWKYLSAAWTLDGRIGERERRWGPLEGDV